MLLENANVLRDGALRAIEDNYANDIKVISHALSAACEKGKFECFFQNNFPSPVTSYLIELGYNVSNVTIGEKNYIKVSFAKLNELAAIKGNLEEINNTLKVIPNYIGNSSAFNARQICEQIDNARDKLESTIVIFH